MLNRCVKGVLAVGTESYLDKREISNETVAVDSIKTKEKSAAFLKSYLKKYYYDCNCC